MFKKSALFLLGLSISQFSLAEVVVNVENDSQIYDLNITSKDVQTSTYVPQPLGTISADDSDQFSVISTYPNTLTIVDVEYSYGTHSYDPTCHFRYVILKDYRSGNMLPQNIIAEADGGSYRDKATCSGKINSFDPSTGNSNITLSANRIKY
jgi:hypothetical protein